MKNYLIYEMRLNHICIECKFVFFWPLPKNNESEYNQIDKKPIQ